MNPAIMASFASQTMTNRSTPRQAPNTSSARPDQQQRTPHGPRPPRTEPTKRQSNSRRREPTNFSSGLGGGGPSSKSNPNTQSGCQCDPTGCSTISGWATPPAAPATQSRRRSQHQQRRPQQPPLLASSHSTSKKRQD
jgi:hypothetical protein